MPLERSAYRGTILEPNDNGFSLMPDRIVLLEGGKIIHLSEASGLSKLSRDKLASLGIFPQENGSVHFVESIGDDPVILTSAQAQENMITANAAGTHDHILQPYAVPGELIIQDNDGGFSGWLPTTLIEGEWAAKQNPDLAEAMIREKLRIYARNGTGAVLEYATSSVECVERVIKVAEEVGINIRVGYVAMDQQVDFMNKGQTRLEESEQTILESTRYLLETYGKKIVVIDRFPIAVSSSTRIKLAALARQYGVSFETHIDESASEQEIHRNMDIYKERGDTSIVDTLFKDGVFEPGSIVGLAHGIHTSKQDRERIGDAIQKGCKVYIRACANSNASLKSHWKQTKDGPLYVPFPLEGWEEIGAKITIGNDQGAGRNVNYFAEMRDEINRYPGYIAPSRVLTAGTNTSLESLGINMGQIVERADANFVVIKMAGAHSFYEGIPFTRLGVERVVDRLIDSAASHRGVIANFVNGTNIAGRKA